MASGLPANPVERLARLEAAFRGPLVRPPLSLLYRASLVLVMLGMLVLPVLYVALAVAAGWGVLAIDGALINADLPGKGLLFLLAAVTGFGGAAVFFMFKPIFAPRPPAPERHLVSRTDEPVLFGFVDRLCGIVGAPAPAAIDLNCQVNAAASFKSRIIALHRRDLQLTIGLPMVAGLTLRQFTGVLAHEFGHFSQGAGMRLTAVIRSVNHWFARVVYERDSWDAALERYSEGGSFYVVGPAAAARAGVWLARKILWVLMTAGHAISCLALRQMEYDADAYETQVAGSETFERTSKDIVLLSVASQHAHGQLAATWQERRLADDLSALIVSCRSSFDQSTVETIDQHSSGAKTGIFHTHPSDADRIAAATRLGAPGIFDSDAPATALFVDFDATSREVTRWHYTGMIGEQFAQAELRSIDQMTAANQVEAEAAEALAEILGDSLMCIRSAPLGRLEPAVLPDRGQAIAELVASRQQMRDASEAATASTSKFSALDDQMLELQMRIGPAEAWAQSGHPVPNTAGDLTALQDELGRLNAQAEAAASGFDRFNALAGERIRLALGLRASAEVPPLVGAVTALQAQQGEILAIRTLMAQVHGALRAVQEAPEPNQPIINPIVNATRVLAARLNRLRTGLAAPFPFEHATRGLPLGHYVVPELPDADEIGQVMGAAQAAIGRSTAIYHRSLAHLCAIVRRVERDL